MNVFATVLVVTNVICLLEIRRLRRAARAARGLQNRLNAQVRRHRHLINELQSIGEHEATILIEEQYEQNYTKETERPGRGPGRG